MKRVYKILAIELAIISILCVLKDLEVFAVLCLVLYAVCLNRSVK